MPIFKNIPKHVVYISLSGTVTKDDVKAYKKEISEKIQDYEKISILVDLSEWSDMTEDALIEDIQFELGLVEKLNKFSKIAIISDKQVFKFMVNFASFFMPLVDVKIFRTRENEQALAFASSLTEKKLPKTDVHFIETDSPDIIAYEINGVLDKESLEKIIPKLKKVFENKKKINLLAKIPNYSGVNLDVFSIPSLFSMKFSAIKHVERYAIVGAKDWLEKLVGIFKPFVSMEIRIFELSEEEEAWKWLKS